VSKDFASSHIGRSSSSEEAIQFRRVPPMRSDHSLRFRAEIRRLADML
jgi:hypothetical protein